MTSGDVSTEETATGQGRGNKLLPLAVLVLVAVVGFGVAYWLAGGDEDDAAPAADEAAEEGAADAAEDEDDEEPPEPDYDITVEPDPDPPVVEGTTFTVEVTDGGEPVTDVGVRIVLDMEGHAHEGVDGDGEEVEPGVYEVPVNFVMRGDWTGTVRVDGAEGGQARERISYNVQ